MHRGADRLTRGDEMVRKRSLAVLVIIVAAAVPRVSMGAAPPAPIPAVWQPPGATALEQLADARGTWLTGGEFDDLRAALLRHHAGGTVIPDAEFVFPSRVGDLDGDGRNDVMTAEFVGEQSALALRRGLDGDVLMEIHDAFSALPVDLEGDGTGELLVQGSSSEQLADGARSIRQTVSRLTLDGTVWTYEVPGAIVRAADPQGGIAADAEFVIGVAPMGDATGDGVDDVWVATSSFIYLDSEVFVVADTFAARTIDGATGLQVGHVVAASAAGLPFAIPAGDVSGDGRADVFALSGLTDGQGVLAAHSTEGVPHWAIPVPTAFAYPSVHEMTGDGIPDLLLQAFTPSGPMRLAFSGRDGSQLWTLPDTGYTDAAGDIDGDGGADLIRIETPSTGVIATAWSGATGQVIWGPVSYAAPDGAWVLNCICTDDLTGDGVWDPLTAEVVFGDPVTVTIRTLDGASGLPLWVTAADPSGTFPVPIGVDIDGDGGTDLGASSSSGTSITARTLRGADFTDLWSVTAPIEGFALGFYGDDLAGDDAPELVMASIRFVDESIRGSAHALDASGIVWAVP